MAFTDYLWIVIFGGILSFLTAIGIGANEVANCFGTSVGARALTLRQAIMVASVCEMAGALLLGSGVTKTIESGIADINHYTTAPELYMYGMLTVLLATGFWMLMATYLELPVSATHATVGGVIGFTMVCRGPGSVIWWDTQDGFPWVDGVAKIFIFWVVAPCLTGVLVVALYLSLRTLVLRRKRSYTLSFAVTPVLFGVSMFVVTSFIINQTGSGYGWNDVSWGVSYMIAGGIGVASVLVSLIIINPLIKRAVRKKIEELKAKYGGSMHGVWRPNYLDANNDPDGDSGGDGDAGGPSQGGQRLTAASPFEDLRTYLGKSFSAEKEKQKCADGGSADKARPGKEAPLAAAAGAHGSAAAAAQPCSPSRPPAITEDRASEEVAAAGGDPTPNPTQAARSGRGAPVDPNPSPGQAPGGGGGGGGGGAPTTWRGGELRKTDTAHEASGDGGGFAEASVALDRQASGGLGEEGDNGSGGGDDGSLAVGSGPSGSGVDLASSGGAEAGTIPSAAGGGGGSGGGALWPRGSEDGGGRSGRGYSGGERMHGRSSGSFAPDGGAAPGGVRYEDEGVEVGGEGEGVWEQGMEADYQRQQQRQLDHYQQQQGQQEEQEIWQYGQGDGEYYSAGGQYHTDGNNGQQLQQHSDGHSSPYYQQGAAQQQQYQQHALRSAHSSGLGRTSGWLSRQSRLSGLSSGGHHNDGGGGEGWEDYDFDTGGPSRQPGVVMVVGHGDAEGNLTSATHQEGSGHRRSLMRGLSSLKGGLRERLYRSASKLGGLNNAAAAAEYWNTAERSPHESMRGGASIFSGNAYSNGDAQVDGGGDLERPASRLSRLKSRRLKRKASKAHLANLQRSSVLGGQQQQQLTPPPRETAGSWRRAARVMKNSSTWRALTYGSNVNVHDMEDEDEEIQNLHERSEKFDANTEYVFRYLQVFSAMANSFAHGSNDVANAIGPFAAILYIYNNKKVDAASDVPIWVLAIGGVGVVIGLALYGYKVVRAIGIKLTKLTNSRGFCVEFSTAVIIIVGSRYSLPLSTTHCMVAAISCLGFLEGRKALNLMLVFKFVIGWLATVIVAALLAAALTAQGVYSPSKNSLRDMYQYHDYITTSGGAELGNVTAINDAWKLTGQYDDSLTQQVQGLQRTLDGLNGVQVYSPADDIRFSQQVSALTGQVLFTDGVYITHDLAGGNSSFGGNSSQLTLDNAASVLQQQLT